MSLNVNFKKMVQMPYRWDNTTMDLYPIQNKQGYNKKQARTHTHTHTDINEKTSS